AIQALRMATINGARTLGLEDRIGSLVPGKLADLVAIDLDHPNTQPVYDPVSTLVYSASARQVSHVWVNGKLLVEHGAMTRLSLTQILDKARHWGERIRENEQP